MKALADRFSRELAITGFVISALFTAVFSQAGSRWVDVSLLTAATAGLLSNHPTVDRALRVVVSIILGGVLAVILIAALGARNIQVGSFRIVGHWQMLQVGVVAGALLWLVRSVTEPLRAAAPHA